eukprot:CAMPEP_0176381912 /NCGR_PEP_ID=MMETSP0126-20121128/32254_1 /TAXON_ID=141414 ORGANISM="Strombidinopsis acuminatum, Strain SPMC142" /NCGR_SAMPLE_ID=MMETSP0126 /ASSEMBLY_ACC=CAM_ASM_000229 /LENGTH=243 /DNA_ID=CAMNT_0017746007 /DNA_START=89 /DNA_END=820 /DNA_ORIENTATION=+
MARLKIVSPPSLAKKFAEKYDDGAIPANYANFGFVPYGRTIMGKLHYCNDNELLCEPIDFGNPHGKLNRTSSDLSPFWITRRGDCSFVQKVRLMENMGVAVGIVVDNNPEGIDGVVMSDDGTGAGIRIPSMLISQADGDILYEFMDSSTEEELKKIAIMAEFKMTHSGDSNMVEFDFWYSSSNDKALDFLEDFAEMDKKLGERVKLTPHFVFWECRGCDPSYLKSDCYGGGKYCAVEPSNHAI